MVRRTSFQGQPPFSSFFSNNFWPIDVDTGRSVTAVRPPLDTFTAPGVSVNGLIPVNGFASGKPFQSIVAASSGSLFWWDGVAWRLATGSAASSADTGRAVFGHPFLQRAYICKEDSAPIDFNYTTGEATIMQALAGTVPEDCRMATVWQGALWLAGQEENPHILYGSRTGDVYDWDFIVNTNSEGGAYTSAGVDEGRLNGPITAIVSHTHDTMLVSTVEGIMAMRGHPRRGGVYEQVSGQTYILGQGAWCRTPEDVLFFMTTLGLMQLNPQPGSVAMAVSQKLIPDELIGLSYSILDPKVNMAYDSRWKLIYITVRGTQEQAWLFDLNTGGFHKMTLDNYPYVLYEHKPFVTDDRSGVLFGKVA